MNKGNLPQRKNPITVNKSFYCKNCKKYNPKAEKTCRNHCSFCMFSMHVDQTIPGDRKSKCFGLMEPIFIDQNGKKGYQIMHRCLRCGKKIINKLADDDSMENVMLIIKEQNNRPVADN